MNVTIVETTYDHVADLTKLLNEIISIGGTTAYTSLRSETDLRHAFLETEQFLACFTALNKEGQVIGFQSLRSDDRVPDDRGDIATFAKVGATAKGIGKALFAETVSFAKSRNLVAIKAVIRADNVPGLAYYNRIGFIDYDIVKDQALEDGTRVDKICKRYDL